MEVYDLKSVAVWGNEPANSLGVKICSGYTFSTDSVLESPTKRLDIDNLVSGLDTCALIIKDKPFVAPSTYSLRGIKIPTVRINSLTDSIRVEREALRAFNTAVVLESSASWVLSSSWSLQALSFTVKLESSKTISAKTIGPIKVLTIWVNLLANSVSVEKESL